MFKKRCGLSLTLKFEKIFSPTINAKNLIFVLLVGAYCYYKVQVPKNIIRSIVTSTLKMLSESQFEQVE